MVERDSISAENIRTLTLSTCKVRIETTPNHVTVSVSGELDMGDADRVSAILREAAESGKPLVRLDLSALTFADSSAVKAILVGARAADENAVAFQLINPHGSVRRLLDVTGLADAMEIVDEPAVMEGPNSL